MSIVAPQQIIGDKSIAFNATTTNYEYGTLGAKFNSNIPFTVLALCRPAGSGEGGFSYVVAKTPSNGGGARLIVDHNAGSPRVIFGLDSNSVANPSRTTNTGFVTYEKWYWIAGTSIASLTGTNLHVYIGDVGGALIEPTYSASTNGTSSIDANTAVNWTVGNREVDDRTFNGDIACVFRWNRTFSLDDLNAALRLGPESVFPEQLVFSWIAGQERITGWTPTITDAAVGRGVRYPIKTIARTPYPVFQVAAGAFFIDAQPATYAITGTDAGLIAGRVLDAQPATYTITGTAAGLIAGRVLDAQPASFAITGFDAGLFAGRVLSADPATYTITGFDANLVYTPAGAFFINAEPASFAITGADAGLIAGRVLSADPAVYTVTGFDAGLFAGRGIDAQPATYTISAFDANLVYTPNAGAFFINAEPASFVINLFAADLFSSAPQVTGGWPTQDEYRRYLRRAPREVVDAEIERRIPEFPSIPTPVKEDLKGMIAALQQRAPQASPVRLERMAIAKLQKAPEYDNVGEQALTYEAFVRQQVREQAEEKIVAQIIIQLLH